MPTIATPTFNVGGPVTATTGAFSSNLTVGGTAAITGAVTLSSTVAVTGKITSNSTGPAILEALSAATGSAYINLQNTGGQVIVGLDNNAGNALAAGGSAYGSHVYAGTATNLHFGTNATVRMTIASGGQVSTTMAVSNTYGLQVSNNHATLPYGIGIGFGGGAPNDATREFLGCSDTVGAKATIRSNGGFANFQANDANLSDGRVKQPSPKTIAGADLTRIWEGHKNLRHVWYKYRDQSHDDFQPGLIAQEVEKVFPELVDDWGDKENKGLKAIYQHDLDNYRAVILQDCQRRIEQLEAKLH